MVEAATLGGGGDRERPHQLDEALHHGVPASRLDVQLVARLVG